MDEVRNKLTQEEKAHLRRLWDDKELLHSLFSALSHKQLSLASTALSSATDFDQVMFLRGQNALAVWFGDFLKHNYKEMKRSEDLIKAQRESNYSQ